MAESIPEMRLKAWIYEGVTVELEMAELLAENRWLKENDPDNEDIDWNSKRLAKLQAKMELVNINVEHNGHYYEKFTP